MPTLLTRSRPAEGVALLTLANPPLNLVSLDLLAELGEALEEVGADDSVRAVVLAGSGDRAFCAGSDVAEFGDVRGDVVERKSRRENEVFRALELLPQPTFAAVAGPAVGGGFELALCCDVRVVAEEAWFSFPELNLGVYPGSGGTYRLARLVGLGRAFELLYSGRRLDAPTALAWGIVNETAAAADVLERTVERAAALARAPALAVQAIKHAVYEGWGQRWPDVEPLLLELTARVFESDDMLEGLAAFHERRTPRFQHR